MNRGTLIIIQCMCLQIVIFIFIFNNRKTLKFEQMHALVPTHSFAQRCVANTLRCPRFIRPYDKTRLVVRWWRCCVNHVIKALRRPFFMLTKLHMVRLRRTKDSKVLCLNKVVPIFKSQNIRNNMAKMYLHR